MENYEFYLATGGYFHSPEEFETWLKEAEEQSIEQQSYEEYLDDDIYVYLELGMFYEK